MKTKNKVEEKKDEILDGIFVDTTMSTIFYCRNIVKSNEADESGNIPLASHSELYNKIIFNTTYDEFLNTFSEYFLLMYPTLFFYVKTEKYECADLIKRAMQIEVEFILKYVLQNFPTLKSDVKYLSKQFDSYFLN
jgi:hypothetical protein